MINKRAEGFMLYFWLLLNFLIIGIAISVSLFIFFSASADVRILEAESISNRVLMKVIDSGYLNEKILDSNYDYFKDMGLNPKMFTYPGKYYFNLTIIQDGKVVRSIIAGNKDFEVLCQINGENYPKCIRKNFFVMDRKNKMKSYEIKFIAGSNQYGEKT